MIVILDNIRSSHNVGSIFRTADAVGAEKIYLAGVTPGPRDRFGRENKQLAKVALRAENYLAWEHVGSALELVRELKNKGWKILALEQAENSVSVFDAVVDTAKCVLVLGEEVGGIGKDLLASADLIVEIPMRGRKESLNVAVAFGIAAYSLLKK